MVASSPTLCCAVLCCAVFALSGLVWSPLVCSTLFYCLYLLCTFLLTNHPKLPLTASYVVSYRILWCVVPCRVVLDFHYICISYTPLGRSLSSSSTVWSTAPGSWTGQRRLHGHEESVSMLESESVFESAAVYVASESMSVHRSLYTTQPSWCSYYGVTCGSVSGTSTYASVISISVSSLGLSGTLPSEIGSFGSMVSLYVGNNRISGTIPSSIGLMKSLGIFNSLYNEHTGSIPASIGSLVALFIVNLDYNSLTGSIPTSISALTGLRYLSIYHNSLTGQIPSGMSHLTKLYYLDLHVNYLTMGSSTVVPTSTFSTATSAGTLDLSSNCLVYRSSAHLSQNTNATHCSAIPCKSSSHLSAIYYVMFCSDEYVFLL